VKCPRCGHGEDKVIDSRAGRDGDVIRRRRECLSCAHRFTTYERVEEEVLLVVKKGGSRQPFDRGKIKGGIVKACEKRPVSAEQIEDLVARIEGEYHASGEREIDSTRIGERIMEGLRKLDDVAYVRFASVYRQFKDVSQFVEEIRSLYGDEGKGRRK
jgi:transcriptional repressor NrdR